MTEIYDFNIQNWVLLELNGVALRWTESYVYMADVILIQELDIYG